MKGRVLVALADGTIAIFHRGVGKSQFVSPVFEKAARKCYSWWLFPPSRCSVGFNQLPPVGSGSTPPLNPLYDGGARQGVVRIQEQDLHHPAQGHENRGREAPPIRNVMNYVPSHHTVSICHPWAEVLRRTSSQREPSATAGLDGRRHLGVHPTGFHSAPVSRSHLPAPPGCRHWALR